MADVAWLDRAVEIAEPLLGTTAENPTVGAMVVDETSGRLLGQGVTARGGRPHAEPQAIAAAGERARGATLYATLEPCNHWGRTPPCVDAVIRAGIRRVVIGIADPDPRTAGQSISRMKAAGITVLVADHRPSRDLHRGHIWRMTRGLPFVTAKLAVSADGMVGRREVGNVAITGEAARRWTHRLRARVNAIMIGTGTARLDNPRLTVRLAGLEDRRPLRVVVAGRRPFETSIDMLESPGSQPVAIMATPESRLRAGPGIEIIKVPGVSGRPDLGAGLSALAGRGIGEVLVEGGPKLIEALLDAGLIDRFSILTSARKIGADGVAASSTGALDARLESLGFSMVDQGMLGADNLRTFERAF